jgi:hypothetical protein
MSGYGKGKKFIHGGLNNSNEGALNALHPNADLNPFTVTNGYVTSVRCE